MPAQTAMDNSLMSGHESRSPKSISLLGCLPLLAGMLAGLWLLRRQRARASRPAPSFDRLRAAIIGNDKSAVISVFGPPSASAGFAALAPAILVKSDYLHADTWYYPLDQAGKTALVVHFEQNIARDAQMVSSPGQ